MSEQQVDLAIAITTYIKVVVIFYSCSQFSNCCPEG